MRLKTNKRFLVSLVINALFFIGMTFFWISFVKRSLFLSFMFGTSVYPYHPGKAFIVALMLASFLCFLLQNICHRLKRMNVILVIFIVTMLVGWVMQGFIFFSFGDLVSTPFAKNLQLTFTLNRGIGIFGLPFWLLLAIANCLLFRNRKNGC